ncbi:alpha/beta fold hydrolase [Paenibacillus pasadenensis]|uniref:alpha/beta fold hydrolase n=1 Tax=Paenibacillus pasadenensis TaxID=217090 RepID=UPI00203B0FA3|nr:alpha/beta hydrolase [Paenibacillus pasadenensis]
MAGDMGELLTELGQGPFLLVGHGWGGPIVRAAAAADLSRIRGLVLVDPSDERCDSKADFASENFTRKAARAMLAEHTAFLEELAKLRAEPPQLGELDVSILTGTVVTAAERRIRPAISAAHRESAAALPNRRLVEAPRSRPQHFVH